LSANDHSFVSSRQTGAIVQTLTSPTATKSCSIPLSPCAAPPVPLTKISFTTENRILSLRIALHRGFVSAPQGAAASAPRHRVRRTVGCAIADVHRYSDGARSICLRLELQENQIGLA
jgi:hypothetical protein